jgi:hypothetical protein
LGSSVASRLELGPGIAHMQNEIMKLFSKTLSLLSGGALTLCVMFLAVRAAASDPNLFRIGYQKYGTLNIVRVHGDLDKALEKAGSNRELFLSTRAFLEKNPDFLPPLVAAVNKAGQWATDKPSEVATYLAKEVGMDPQTFESIVRRQPWGFRAVDAAVIADQQAIADLFFSLKLIPRSIRVSDAVVAAPAVTVFANTQ